MCIWVVAVLGTLYDSLFRRFRTRDGVSEKRTSPDYADADAALHEISSVARCQISSTQQHGITLGFASCYPHKNRDSGQRHVMIIVYHSLTFRVLAPSLPLNHAKKETSSSLHTDNDTPSC